MEHLNPSTLEEARELLLQQNNTIAELNQRIESLTSTSEENVRTIEELRTLNQKLFLRVSTGEEPENPSHDEPAETLEEYAVKNLKGLLV